MFKNRRFCQFLTKIFNDLKTIETSLPILLIWLLAKSNPEYRKFEGAKYNYDQCDYKAHLIQHQKSVHEGVKYNCFQCDYKANYHTDLIKHKNTVHEGVFVKKWHFFINIFTILKNLVKGMCELGAQILTQLRYSINTTIY